MHGPQPRGGHHRPAGVGEDRNWDWEHNGIPNTSAALASFSYGMLRVALHGALEQVGLDPYIGYLHGVRPGKPALALDLMEEFRPLIADRFVMTLLNRRELKDSDFTYLPGDVVELKDDTRRTVLNAGQVNRQRLWPHAQLSREVPAALLPLIQARLLARHLRGDLPEYLPWTVT